MSEVLLYGLAIRVQECVVGCRNMVQETTWGAVRVRRFSRRDGPPCCGRGAPPRIFLEDSATRREAAMVREESCSVPLEGDGKNSARAISERSSKGTETILLRAGEARSRECVGCGV